MKKAILVVSKKGYVSCNNLKLRFQHRFSINANIELKTGLVKIEINQTDLRDAVNAIKTFDNMNLEAIIMTDNDIHKDSDDWVKHYWTMKDLLRKSEKYNVQYKFN